MNANTISELISALHDSGIGVNIIILEMKEDEDEEFEEETPSLGLRGPPFGGGVPIEDSLWELADGMGTFELADGSGQFKLA